MMKMMMIKTHLITPPQKERKKERKKEGVEKKIISIALGLTKKKKNNA